jgi:hypothetical protein
MFELAGKGYMTCSGCSPGLSIFEYMIPIIITVKLSNALSLVPRLESRANLVAQFAAGLHAFVKP